MNTSYGNPLLTQSLQPTADCKKFYWCNRWAPVAVLLAGGGGGGGGQPWLQRLLGNNVAPQVGSISNQAVWDNTARRWNGVNARRTTKSNAANHLPYCATGNNLVAARCTAEPLVVMAGNRVFLCILQCCMAMRRLFLAFLEAKLGYHPLYVAGEVQKIPSRNRYGVLLTKHDTAHPRGPQPFLGLGRNGACACIHRRGPHVSSGCGSPNIATHFILANSGCSTSYVLTCCYCVSGTLLRGVKVPLSFVPRRGF